VYWQLVLVPVVLQVVVAVQLGAFAQLDEPVVHPEYTTGFVKLFAT
jgi:hypothetical protein